MPLTLMELQDIQADAMADDIPIDEAKMMHWTREEATEFFESGGTVEPAAPSTSKSTVAAAPSEPSTSAPAAEAAVDEAAYSAAPITKIALFLSENGFEHLFDTLSSMSDADVDNMLKATKDENLAALKERGVEKLKDRQGLAQAVLKAKRAREAAEKEAAASGSAVLQFLLKADLPQFVEMLKGMPDAEFGEARLAMEGQKPPLPALVKQLAVYGMTSLQSVYFLNTLKAQGLEQ